jgi:hypothetical protein
MITLAERGKPVAFREDFLPEGKSRDDLTTRRVKDAGASERLAVIAGIRVAPPTATSPDAQAG